MYAKLLKRELAPFQRWVNAAPTPELRAYAEAAMLREYHAIAEKLAGRRQHGEE